MSAIPKSEARLEFRLTSDRKQEIERAATAQNQSLTEFATAALTDAARKVLAEFTQYEHVQLSNRDRDRFFAVLDADAAPNAALQAAAKRHRQRVA
jgi:uncharacterized protein (DUF1778 family)